MKFFIFRYKNFKKKSIKKFSKKKFHKKESFLLNFKKYFYKIYEKNINEIFNNIKDRKFIDLTSKLIKESEFSHNNKTIFQRWLKEELVAIYLAKKNRKRIKFIIDSEGIIQRLFIYIYKKKNKNKIVKKYLKFCPIPHHLVVMKRKVFLKKKINQSRI